MEDQKPKVTKDANLGAVVFRFPQVEEVLLDYGLHCTSCIAAGFDTIEMGAKAHGMPDDEVEEMIERMNEVIAHAE